MEQQTFSRQQLYDLVWSSPMTTLIKRYKVSEYRLRKICIEHAIPVPYAGYWQQLQVGKASPQPPLRMTFKGADAIQLTVSDAGKGSSSNDKLMLQVPHRLTNPHPLVAKTRDALAQKKPDNWLYKGTVHCSGNGIDIRVTPSNVSR